LERGLVSHKSWNAPKIKHRRCFDKLVTLYWGKHEYFKCHKRTTQH